MNVQLTNLEQVCATLSCMDENQGVIILLNLSHEELEKF